jgi:hypothetical protein
MEDSSIPDSIPKPIPSQRIQLIYDTNEILESIEAETDPIMKQTLIESYQSHQPVIAYANIQEEKVAKMLEENRRKEREEADLIRKYQQLQIEERQKYVQPLLQFLSTYSDNQPKVNKLKNAIKDYVEKKKIIPYSILLPWEKETISPKIKEILDNLG